MSTPHPWFRVEEASLLPRPRTLPSAPVVEQLSDRGMVFRSALFLPVGTQLALGLHVAGRGRGGGERIAEGTAGAPSHGEASGAHSAANAVTGPGSTFLALHGMVVECHMESPASDEHAYEVTVLFEGVGREEAGLLREASHLCRRRRSAWRLRSRDRSRRRRPAWFGPN